MEIRPVDIHSDVDMHAWYEALRSGETYGRPDSPFDPEHALVTEFRDSTDREEMHAFGAFEGSELVAAAWLGYTMLDNLEKAWFQIDVPYEHRSAGIGSALLEHLVELARSAGRTTVLCEARIPFGEIDAHPYRRFLERHEFALANTEVRRDLRLPASDQLLAAIDEEAAAPAAAYELLTCQEIPDDLIESFCAVFNLLPVEAPSGDIDFEKEAMTPAVLREEETLARKANLQVYATLAVDPRGMVAAYTTICVPLDDPGTAHQWGTLVHPDHRGNRLGLAIKAQNLRVLQREHPECVRVSTCNAEQNPYMISINERLGFVPVELMAAFQRHLGTDRRDSDDQDSNRVNGE